MYWGCMIELLIIPEGIYENYLSKGVQFNKLLCPNYIVSVCSMADITDMDKANIEFPFDFSDVLPMKRVDPPSLLIEMKASSGSIDSFKLTDIHRRLKERQATIDLIPNTIDDNIDPMINTYRLHNVDENLWVIVQSSEYVKTNDPVQLCIKANHEFFDSMLEILSNRLPLEQLATSNLFKHYLSSSK